VTRSGHTVVTRLNPAGRLQSRERAAGHRPALRGDRPWHGWVQGANTRSHLRRILTRTRRWPILDYDLAATLDCGQAFRWQRHGGAWTGVIGGRWVRLSCDGEFLIAETAEPQTTWRWLEDYLQLEVRLDEVLRTFPRDRPMRTAVRACRGLRLLRQDPWECLASFLLSATKQIAQIRQIIATLCRRFGEPVGLPAGEGAAFAFPTAERLARLTEAELRRCKMGFRAPHLLEAARAVAEGRLELSALGSLPLAEARAQLMQLDGVGPKIADCVLLFACGFPEAFPMDVWVQRALRQLYFGGRAVATERLRAFAAAHFGPQAGYAQQYLFHFMRTHRQQDLSA
jgi:N-glycosylase/DNA lyase